MGSLPNCFSHSHSYCWYCARANAGSWINSHTVFWHTAVYSNRQARKPSFQRSTYIYRYLQVVFNIGDSNKVWYNFLEWEKPLNMQPFSFQPEAVRSNTLICISSGLWPETRLQTCWETCTHSHSSSSSQGNEATPTGGRSTVKVYGKLWTDLILLMHPVKKDCPC